MANKPVTTDTAANAQYLSSRINGNFSVIEDAVESCLGRGGTNESPNSMNGDLDMDLHKIINVGAPSNDNDAVRLIDLSDSDATGAASATLRIDVGSAINVDTYTELKALTTPTAFETVILKGRASITDRGGGIFYWNPADLSTEVTADTQSGIYVAPNSDTTGASGAWVREWTGIADLRWFGGIAGNSSDYEEGNVTALNAALVVVKNLFIPSGIWRFNGSITVPSYARITGEQFELGNTGTTYGTDIRFNISSGDAFACGSAPTFERLKFQCIGTGATYTDATYTYGSNTAICIALTDNATIKDCLFLLWQKCIEFGTTSYYVRTYNVEFNRCNVGYITNGVDTPYNTNIENPRSVFCNTFYSGNGLYPTNIRIVGGSIEKFKFVCYGFKNVSVFGTYFETSNDTGGVFAFAPLVSECSVSIFGCIVYLGNVARFVNLSGRTGASLTMSGNRYRGSSASSSGAIVLYLPTTGDISVGGDAFDSDVRDDVKYVFSMIINSGHLSHPVLPATNADVAKSGKTFMGSNGWSMPAISSAPSTTGIQAGTMFLADGVSWDPLSLAASRPYYVIWQGDRWRAVSG